MKVGITKELFAGECRVAATPETGRRLIEKLGFEVLVETGAGEAASFHDEQYRDAGCVIVADAAEVWRASDIVLKVRMPVDHELEQLREGQTLVGFLAPAQNGELLEAIAAKKATALAIDAVPRISRAQKLDALSSTANIAGYRAVVEAASLFGRFFTGQITAAGKVPPAKVMVIGAGVAGLAAIGTARGLGAIVRAFDVRPEVADQVKSMGAEFLMLDFEQEDGGTSGGYAKTMSQEFIEAEMALFAAQAKEVDIIITTALIPGKPAPKLITSEMVSSMRPGSVVVDLAAEQGGNCELTVPDQVVQHGGVHIVGYSDLASRLAHTSSQLYGTNLYHLLDELGGSENFNVNMDDAVIRGVTVVKDGAITWPPPPVAVSAESKTKKPEEPEIHAAITEAEKDFGLGGVVILAVAALVLIGIAMTGNQGFITDFTVFVLACIVGWQVIWNVTAALHTPLMSVTNAISGIIIVGGLVQVGVSDGPAAILGAIAIFFATINIAGGFLVTQRMLKMFRK